MDGQTDNRIMPITDRTVQSAKAWKQ